MKSSSLISGIAPTPTGAVNGATIRVLFVFDPWRSAILLIAGDKAGQWKAWYERAIPQAEELYAVYLKERAEEEG